MASPPSSGSLDAPVKVSAHDGFSLQQQRLLQQQADMAVMQGKIFQQLAELRSSAERLLARWSTTASDEVSPSPSSASSSVSSSPSSAYTSVSSSPPLIPPILPFLASIPAKFDAPVPSPVQVQKALDFFAPRVPTKYYPAEAESVPAMVEEQVHSLTPTLSKPEEAAERPPAEPPSGVVDLVEELGLLPNSFGAKSSSVDGKPSNLPIVDYAMKSVVVDVKVGEKLLVVKDANGDVFHLKFAKLHLIPFSDENPRSWLRTCVSFILGGRAIKWFTGFLADKGVPWKEFGEQFVVGFHYVCEDFLSQMLLGFQFTGDCGCTSSYYAAPVLPIKIGANKWKRELAVGGWIYLQQTSVHMRSSLQLCKQIGEAWCKQIGATETLNVDDIGDPTEGVLELVESDLEEIEGDQPLHVLLNGVELLKIAGNYKGQSLLIKVDGGTSLRN